MTSKQQVPSNTEADSKLDMHALTSILRTSSSVRRRTPLSSVSFSPINKLAEIEYPYDYDRQSYTSEDVEKFKKESREEVVAFLRLKYGSCTPHHSHCHLNLVGLEQYVLTPNVLNQQAHLRELVRYAVLSEQALLKGFVGDTSAYIADASRHCSEQSALQAKLIGDFQFIQSKET